MDINFIFSIAILIISIVIHEVSHGYAAYFLGDPTAKYAGRLTLNPIKHLDPFGSVIVPLITALLPGGIVFGWAKPVPFNPYNLTKRLWGLPAQAGEAIVAVAGPASNILLVLVFGFLIRFLASSGALSQSLFDILSLIVFVNITLAIFNLMPIPPLDGSKILYSVLPYKWLHIRENIERHAFLYVIIFIFLIWPLFAPIIPWLFTLVTGISF